jgi:hypothetical protein
LCSRIPDILLELEKEVIAVGSQSTVARDKADSGTPTAQKVIDASTPALPLTPVELNSTHISTGGRTSRIDGQAATANVSKDQP